ncbi:MAG: PP2C family protein-serine/threonine phosphatase [Planctomycetes bacterium]|nr:PP2C family protein-serine/threonine phosphatase [Planctomycetota bacterium]
MTVYESTPVGRGVAVGLAGLHACRSREEVSDAMAKKLAELMPGVAMAVLLAQDESSSLRVERVVGVGCPWRVGEDVASGSWPVPASQRLAISYREYRLGFLVVGDEIDASARNVIDAALAHYGVALVNLTFNAEALRATDNYCASLQALEEGIVLFQEESAEAVQARLLSLASSMLHATAAALYVLREIGDPASGLALAATLGMPESLLATFACDDGSPWPDNLVGQPAQLFESQGPGSLAGLDESVVPDILDNVVAMPLRYHGVDAGVCVLFNASIDAESGRDYLGRVQSLGQLGAALLHRLQLEAVAIQNRAIERELQIAEIIQRRLLPAAVPTKECCDFAWLSIPARFIGGDYLDILESEDGEVNAVVADVSGHGINSALLMSSFRGAYRGEATRATPTATIESLNDVVAHEVGSTGMFVTAIAVRVSPCGYKLTICSAGHNPGFLFRAATGTIETIDSGGPPLGFLAGARFEERVLEFTVGDVLLLYTDGVTEAANGDDEMFGEERLTDLLSAHAGGTAAELVETIRAEVSTFQGREHFEDDLSILVVKARQRGANTCA